MKMPLAAMAALLAVCAAAPAQSPARDVLYQLSTYSALKAGAYDGFQSYGEVKKHGDFGIGAFDAMDGEMILLDGTVYRVASDGKVAAMDDSARSSYCTVTFFDADQDASLENSVDYAYLKSYLDTAVPTNRICAVRITGTFMHVKTRSVPAQAKPYPPLDEVIRQQTVFEFNNIAGTAIGFRFPSFMDGVQVPGYHLHFLTADKTGGGHLLDFKTEKVQVEIDDTPEFRMILP
jgi:acetolactate decarboxylase